MLPDLFDPPRLETITQRLRALPRRVIEGDRARAAVIVPLCHVEGRPAMLFTKRTETVGSHKGQVSFPGGRIDPGDTDETAAALRELEEEVGIRSGVHVLGPFHEAVSINGLRVTPIVAFLGELDVAALRLSTAEIDFAFALTLDAMSASRERHDLGGYILPRFTAGPVPVWGLTAYIADAVLRELLGLEVEPISPDLH